MSGRTEDQVRCQLGALSCERYEVGILPPKGVDLPRERIRTWSAEQVLRSTSFLRARNAAGYDIYIRPAPLPADMAEGLSFVDDLNLQTTRRMAADGLPFAALIESSEGSFHGWIRISAEPIDRHLLSAAAKVIATRYGGDPHCADWRHFGRLAGFTNRKPTRRTDRGQPFALLQGATSGVAPRATHVLNEAHSELRRAAASRVFQAQKTAARQLPLHVPASAAAAFRDAWERAGQTKGDGTPDGSARDFSACLSLLRAGHGRDAVIAALATSPALYERHALPEDYIQRTVDRAAEIIEGGPRP